MDENGRVANFAGFVDKRPDARMSLLRYLVEEMQVTLKLLDGISTSDQPKLSRGQESEPSLIPNPNPNANVNSDTYSNYSNPQ